MEGGREGGRGEGRERRVRGEEARRVWREEGWDEGGRGRNRR